MSSFTDPLEVRKLAGTSLWVTLRAMHYWTDCEPGEGDPALRCRTVYVVPDLFETDFASIPQLFWTLIGHPAGEYAQAAVLHDWLYRAKLVPRREADRIFREAMGVLGVPGWKAFLMWSAVRMGGGAAFSKEEPHD